MKNKFGGFGMKKRYMRLFPAVKAAFFAAACFAAAHMDGAAGDYGPFVIASAWAVSTGAFALGTLWKDFNSYMAREARRNG